jgi:hypothetical protein
MADLVERVDQLKPTAVVVVVAEYSPGATALAAAE